MTLHIYSSPLLRRVQKLVRERPATLQIKDLAKEVEVSPVWLSGFAMGKFPNPSACVVEKLYVRLTGKQLINDEP